MKKIYFMRGLIYTTSGIEDILTLQSQYYCVFNVTGLQIVDIYNVKTSNDRIDLWGNQ